MVNWSMAQNENERLTTKGRTKGFAEREKLSEKRTCDFRFFHVAVPKTQVRFSVFLSFFFFFLLFLHLRFSFSLLLKEFDQF